MPNIHDDHGDSPRRGPTATAPRPVNKVWGSEQAAALVNAIYAQVLERGVDDVGMIGWGGALATGSKSVKEVVRDLAKSPEYENRFIMPFPPKHAVTLLYKHLLGRTPDEEGLRSNTKVLAEGGVSAVVDVFIDSPEYAKEFGNDHVPHRR